MAGRRNFAAKYFSLNLNSSALLRSLHLVAILSAREIENRESKSLSAGRQERAESYPARSELHGCALRWRHRWRSPLRERQAGAVLGRLLWRHRVLPDRWFQPE